MIVVLALLVILGMILSVIIADNIAQKHEAKYGPRLETVRKQSHHQTRPDTLPPHARSRYTKRLRATWANPEGE